MYMCAHIALICVQLTVCSLITEINTLSSMLNLDCLEEEVVVFVVSAAELAGQYLALVLQSMACLLVENSSSFLISHTYKFTLII